MIPNRSARPARICSQHLGLKNLEETWKNQNNLLNLLFFSGFSGKRVESPYKRLGPISCTACWRVTSRGCCCSVQLLKFGLVRLSTFPVWSGSIDKVEDTSPGQISDLRSLKFVLSRSGPVRKLGLGGAQG